MKTIPEFFDGLASALQGSRPKANHLESLPPCLVLTIPEAKHRALKTAERLEKAGIEADFFYGVSKFEEGFERHCLYRTLSGTKSPQDFGLTPGAMACAMSHVQLWGEVCRQNLPSALILEDDVMPQMELEDIKTALAELPSDAHFASCHSWGVHNREENGVLIKSDVVKLEVGLEHWWRTSYCANTLVGYWVSQEGARRLLATAVPYWQPIDQMVQRASASLNAYQAKLALFNADYTMGSLINDRE